MAEKSLHMLRTVGLAVLATLILANSPAFADDDSLVVARDAHTPPLMNALNLIAQGAGYYKEAHLNVSALLTHGSQEALQACSSGKADICPIGIEPLIARQGEDMHLKMFLSRASKFGYVIAVPADSPIKTLADFKGMRLGVHSSSGTSGVAATISSLSAAGLKSTDYQIVTIGLESQAMDALAAGKADAAALPFYELIPFMVSGTKLRILRHPTLGAFANAGYAASPEEMAGKTEALKRFSRAIVKASLLVRYNPKAAARALLAADGQPSDDTALAAKTAELTVWEEDLPASDPDSHRIGEISMPGMQSYIQLLADAGAIKAAIPVSTVVTDEFIPYANDFDRKAFERSAKAAQ
jgi:NitT/TauT family transport system substrate-binding protein